VLKIIPFYTNEKQLIKKAISGNPEAQKYLYEKHASKMLSICRQYIKDVAFAEDVMIMGFVKVFKYLDTFKFEGSFEGWVCRIMVREAITHLRKNQFVVFDDEVFDRNYHQQIETASEIDIEQIQGLIDKLPEGYKMVFVMYAIEGYKHVEIAEMLQISEGTSKSQLFKARGILQEQLKETKKIGYGTN
jgi:RNA polymerase sigma-70 factor (ECF subfamily)